MTMKINQMKIQITNRTQDLKIKATKVNNNDIIMTQIIMMILKARIMMGNMMKIKNSQIIQTLSRDLMIIQALWIQILIIVIISLVLSSTLIVTLENIE